MDILKELFGTCDGLQINKSLFGSEVGHVESLNMGLGGIRAVQLYGIHFVQYYEGWSLPYAPYYITAKTWVKKF